MIEKCPECGEKIAVMPIREPLPNSTAGGTPTTLAWTVDAGDATQSINFPYQPQYSSTYTYYKCSNPKCWVTKITENWE